MADKSSGSGGPGGTGDRPQDDLVARNPSDPSGRSPRTPTLSGLLDDDCFTHRGHSVCRTGVCNG